MTQGTILTKNIRFPKDNLPDGFNVTKCPQWIEDIEIEYTDNVLQNGKGTYVVKRLHGPSAGSQNTPVYMDQQGQPRPITDISNEFIENGNLADRFQEIENKITEAQVTLSENSPFLNIVRTKNSNNVVNYEIQESLSEFITRNNGNVSILDNFIIHKITTTPAGISLSLGEGLISNTIHQLVLGKYNVASTGLLVIGNGTDNNHRNNLFEINNNGDVIISGEIKKANGVKQGTVYVGSEEPQDSNTLIWINPNA